MSYPEKINAALTILAATNISPYHYAPPLYRLLWRANIPVPPPHFSSVVLNSLSIAPWISIGWGGFIWKFFFYSTGVPAVFFAMMAVLIGVAAGFGIAICYQESARKHKLPCWTQVAQ